MNDLSDQIKKSKAFSAEGFENDNGSAYGRMQEWLSFFGKINENISRMFNTKTVLDLS